MALPLPALAPFKIRLLLLAAVWIGLLAAILVRVGALQLIHAGSYREVVKQRVQPGLELQTAGRGDLRDRHGRLLAGDRPSYDLLVRVDRLRLGLVTYAEYQRIWEPYRRLKREDPPAAEGRLQESWTRVQEELKPLPDRLVLDPWVGRLAEGAGLPEAEVAQALHQALCQVARGWERTSTPVPLLLDLPEERWASLRARQADVFKNPELTEKARRSAAGATGLEQVGVEDTAFPGLLCGCSERRAYPYGQLLAHALGHLGGLPADAGEQLRATGACLEQRAERERLWRACRETLSAAQRQRIRALLGSAEKDLLESTALPELLAGLRRLQPLQRQGLADLGLADAVRWSEQPERVVLQEAERLWVGLDVLPGFPFRLPVRGALPEAKSGVAGLEAYYNQQLRPKAGLRIPEQILDQAGAGYFESLRPVEGQSLRLTVDLAWQLALERVLKERPEPAAPAAAVVLDCRSGEVLAMASFPDFDPNLYSASRLGAEQAQRLQALQQDPAKPLLNRCVGDHYPLGSVMKVLVAAAALQEGLVEAGQTFHCPGQYTVQGRVFRCEAHGQWGGTVTLAEALRRSCNWCFYQLGSQLGRQRLAPYAQAVGLGRRTGLDLEGEQAGLFPSDGWLARSGRGWSKGQDFLLAIGQGDLAVTPLQAACLIGAIANGGRGVRPRLWQGASGSTEPETIQAPLFSGSVLAEVRRGLEEVVEVGTPGARGTAYLAFHGGVEPLAVKIAGKTGTADTAPGRAPHAWFAGYAPAEQPRIAFCFFVQHGGHGGEVAAPLAYRFFRQLYGVRSHPTPDPYALDPRTIERGQGDARAPGEEWQARVPLVVGEERGSAPQWR